MISEDKLLDYYAKGWELGFLDLCDERKLRKSRFKFRILTVMDMIDIENSKTRHILDLGCGVATVSILIGRRYSNTKFYCVDISEIQIEAAREYVRSNGMEGRFEFLIADVTGPMSFAGDRFDYVLCSEVVEHLPEPDKFLERIRDLGDDSTKFVFSFPLGKNKNNCICYRVVDNGGPGKVVDSPSKLGDSEDYYEFYHRLYSIEEADSLLSKHGFRTKKAVSCTFLSDRTVGYYINRLTWYSYTFDRLLNKISFSRLAGNVIFLCSK